MENGYLAPLNKYIPFSGRMRKFDSLLEKGILVGYLSTRKVYKRFNIRLNKVLERNNVMVDEKGGQKIKKRKMSHWNRFMKKK
jgi:hypothetical protein